MVPAQKTPLLQRRNQPVNTGFRPKLKRQLHFLETRRNPGLLQMAIDETEELVLFTCQHLARPCFDGAGGEQTGNRDVLILFHAPRQPQVL
jgi:hypothetical protein